MLWIVRTVGSTIGGLMKSHPGTNLWGTSGSYMPTETSTEGHFGTGRSVRLSVPRRSCPGYRHAGCLQLSHRRPPEMRGLRTRPRTDVDPPRFLPPSNCHRRGGISSHRPRGDTLFPLGAVHTWKRIHSAVLTWCGVGVACGDQWICTRWRGHYANWQQGGLDDRESGEDRRGCPGR